MPFRARARPASIASRRHATRSLTRARPATNSLSVYTHQPSTPRPAQNGLNPIQSAKSIQSRQYFTSASTSASSILRNFFKRHETPPKPSITPTGAHADFLTATRNHNIPALTKAYDTLVYVIDQDPTSSTSRQKFPSAEDHLAAMDQLSRIDSPEALPLLYRIYTNYCGRFGFEETPERHRIMIQAFCKANLVGNAMAIAETRDDQEAQWTPILRSAVSLAWVRGEDEGRRIGRIKEISEHIRRGPGLGLEDYGLLLCELRRGPRGQDNPLKLGQLSDLLWEMENADLTMDRKCESEVARLYLKFGRPDKGIEIVKSWDHAEEITVEMWKAVWDSKRGCGHIRAEAVDLCHRMTRLGHTPLPRMMAYLVDSRLSASTIRAPVVERVVSEVEQETGVEVSTEAWRCFLYAYMKKKRKSDILEVYHAAQARGIAVDAGIAMPVIQSLCSRTPPRLKDAMMVYNDFCSSRIAPSGSDLEYRQYLSDLYGDLFSICSLQSDGSELPTAMRLLNDMKNRGVNFADKQLESLLRLMKSASSHAAAYKLYSLMHSLDRSEFTKHDFDTIATTFVKLSWEDSRFAPVQYYVEMIKDMHRAGYRPGSWILTSLLHSYGARASQAKLQAIKGLIEDDEPEIDLLLRSIEQLHLRIKLDPLINVDIPLLNALMDAYGRCAAIFQAFDVWEELIDRRSREIMENVKNDYAISIATILDICGWYYRTKRARKIFRWVRRHNLADTQKIWDTYVECLCRSEEMEEALELVCVEMKNGIDGAVRPGRKTCEILLKFSWRDPVWFELVQKRIRECFPGWWEGLRGIVEKSPERWEKEKAKENGAENGNGDGNEPHKFGLKG